MIFGKSKEITNFKNGGEKAGKKLTSSVREKDAPDNQLYDVTSAGREQLQIGANTPSAPPARLQTPRAPTRPRRRLAK